MKVLFVDNLLFEGGLSHPTFDLQPHLGLMSLVSVLRKRGLQAVIYDPKIELANGELTLSSDLYRAVASRIAAHDADVVGFTALGCNFPFVVRTAQRLKAKQPHRPILLGGPHATILHREALERFACFDVVVRHEAEETLPLALTALGGNHTLLTVPSITFRTRNNTILSTGSIGVVEDLDSLPVPAYDAYPIAELGLSEIRIEAGRGCPFSCTFCSTASFFGRQYRLKSSSRLLQEMDALHAAYGFSTFKLNHDLFTVNRKKVLAFCQAVRDRAYEWSCSARMDCVDEELLTHMKSAGCRQIYFGVETGSPRMQDISRKKLDLALVEPTLDITERLKIRSITSFIVGYPQETLADQDDTLNTVAKLHLRRPWMNTGQLHLLTPEPGTALIGEFHKELAFDEHVSEFNFPMLDEDDLHLVSSCPDVFPNHHYLPSVVPRDRNIFVTTLWVTLHELGRATMFHLLGLFSHRLSYLVEEALTWMREARPRTSAVDGFTLLAFVEHRFGMHHPMASMIRFATSRVRLLRQGVPPVHSTRCAGEADAAIALSPYVELLRDIHDVPALLSKPANEQILWTLDDVGPRQDRLLLMTVQGLRYFELGSETAAWLARLPAAGGNSQSRIQRMVAGDALTPAVEDIVMLVELGVLTVTREEHADS
ncbi:radical SAM protein [Paraburkholderia strydomiana]|uniref:B12-binding domain-containing radical SAM protein n=1 Tax=Paraburkholderia strydomiana TaxID=1245417 RepID=UPI0038BDBB26